MRIAIALLLLTTMAMADELQPQATSMEQALGQKLMEEINANIQLRVQLNTANAKIKELEDEKKGPKDAK